MPHIVQKQAALIQQLEEELRLSHLRNPEADIQHLEALYAEKEHKTREIYLLREKKLSVVCDLTVLMNKRL
ncbi:hypothetical protein CEXT_106101 [Caerostris extrusa]|uniref:DUF465 domain-containing protein n=1 Tax=Caerostris extrusa TaxID=172846 RepID=A0AAV4QNG1_CAEEX|nr:hypothetical protein CEXT_106101 [Caerostris extrusa]